MKGVVIFNNFILPAFLLLLEMVSYDKDLRGSVLNIFFKVSWLSNEWCCNHKEFNLTPSLPGVGTGYWVCQLQIIMIITNLAIFPGVHVAGVTPSLPELKAGGEFSINLCGFILKIIESRVRVRCAINLCGSDMQIIIMSLAVFLGVRVAQFTLPLGVLGT